MNYYAIIVAGGSGSRSGGKKQWMLLSGKRVLDYSIDAFQSAKAKAIFVVVPSDDIDMARSLYSKQSNIHIVEGGDERTESVKNAIIALKPFISDLDPVLIHDAARPLLNVNHINGLLNKLNKTRSAIMATPMTDSLKKVDGDLIKSDQSRENLWRAQTPQAFRYGDLSNAYLNWPKNKIATDDASIALYFGIDIAIVEGDHYLHKLTYPSDFNLLETLIEKNKPLQNITKIGNGYDVHAWGAGKSVWLCGIEIDNDKSLIGHSDADAGLHALTDALLGAAGLGDIGDYFPPSDPQWKGMPSHVFLSHSVDLIEKMGGSIVNVDITLICEHPKIKPHRLAMRQRLAEILNINIDCVSVKATTTEGLGFTGREEGLAAQAVCLISVPKMASNDAR